MKQSLLRSIVGAAIGTFACAVSAQSAIKIGVMTDMAAGSADLAGQGSVVAARMAVDDFGGKVLGQPIALISADHQAKADTAASIARKWFDTEAVTMVIDLPTSSAAIAVQELAKEKKRIVIVSTGASTQLTSKNCSPTGFHWTYDAYSNSVPLARELIKQGKDSFFYITVDYAFGKSLEDNFRAAVTEFGGKNVGGTKHPLNGSDFSSQVVTAKSSNAKVVVLANAGADLINSMKTAGDFGVISGGQTVIIPVAFLTDIKSIGLNGAQGLQFVDAFKTDQDAKSLDFVKRFTDLHKKAPTMAQSGVYSGVLHYLKAVQAANSADALAVAAKMRELPVNDPLVRNGKVREDGRMVHDMYIAQVKTPAESKGPWDLLKYVSTIPADKAFAPPSSECSLVKR
jgi:branched-chain amino acid transport system substrate-binding protein